MISSLRLIDAIRSLSTGHDKPITASLLRRADLGGGTAGNGNQIG
jgi:hypothetical protein